VRNWLFHRIWPISSSSAGRFANLPTSTKYHIGRALRQIEVEGLEEIERDRNFTVDVGEPGTSCGLALCVPTTDKDQCFWSQYYDRNGEIARGNDNVPVMRRFVCDRTPPFTNKLTLVIRYEDGVLYVIAAYYGEESKKFPGTNGSTVDDARWWFDPETKIGHALCATKAMLEAKRFVKGTVTQVCPWSYDRK
jgi:hypothetical protein